MNETESDELNELNQLNQLKREVAALREELSALKRLLFLAPEADLREATRPLAMYCASLNVLPVSADLTSPTQAIGQELATLGSGDNFAAELRLLDSHGVQHTGLRLGDHGGEVTTRSVDGRFETSLSVSEDGGALHLTDEAAGETRERAALVLTEEGATLALCGRDGVPRLVAQSRHEGGGVSMVNDKRDLSAEVWGAGEASWLALYRDGQPAVMSVALEGGGAVEAFDAHGELLDAVPPTRHELFPPPSDA